MPVHSTPLQHALVRGADPYAERGTHAEPGDLIRASARGQGGGAVGGAGLPDGNGASAPTYGLGVDPAAGLAYRAGEAARRRATIEAAAALAEATVPADGRALVVPVQMRIQTFAEPADVARHNWFGSPEATYEVRIRRNGDGQTPPFVVELVSEGVAQPIEQLEPGDPMRKHSARARATLAPIAIETRSIARSVEVFASFGAHGGDPDLHVSVVERREGKYRGRMHGTGGVVDHHIRPEDVRRA